MIRSMPRKKDTSKTEEPKRGPGRPPKGAAPKPRTGDRHAMPRESFHLPDDLLAALLDYLNHTSPTPDKSEVHRTSLQEFLERKGFWPRRKPT